jgi:hypothetical protein
VQASARSLVKPMDDVSLMVDEPLAPILTWPKAKLAR